MNEIMEVLDDVPFLQGENEETRRSFAELGVCRTFPKGNILFHHDDPCLAACLVVSGKVKLTVAGEDGRELILDLFGPGHICGLVAAIDEGPHTGTAITATNSRIAILPREPFAHWLSQRPHLQGRMLLHVARLLRHAYERVGNQALLSVKLRVRAALVEMAQAEGTLSALHEFVVTRPTHQELAERVGSTRVVVSRAIKTLLEEEDCIRMEGTVLRVRLEAVETAEPARMMRAR